MTTTGIHVELMLGLNDREADLKEKRELAPETNRDFWDAYIKRTKDAQDFMSWVFLETEFYNLVEKYNEKLVEDFKATLR